VIILPDLLKIITLVLLMLIFMHQSLLFLLNAACLAEKQQMPIFIFFGLTRPGLELTIYRTRGEHANQRAL
jgi:hypothetical protein